MNRIYETMMQLKTGNFSYFISLYSFEQSGRIVNALYGPLLSYLLGFILLITGSWLKFQVVTSFLLNIISALGIYKIGTLLKLSEKSKILCGGLYMASYITISWNHTGHFTTFGSALIPFVLYYGIQMNTSNNQSFSPVGLGLSMGLLIQTHMFSSLLATIALFPFILYAFIKKPNRNFIAKLLLSILIAIFISLNVWVGMIYLMRTNTLLQTAPMEMSVSSVNLSSLTSTGRTTPGLVYILIFLGQIFYVIFNWSKVQKYEKLISITGGSLLILSSRLLPWSLIENLFPTLKSTVQFPSRIIVIPYLLLIVGFGILSENSKSQSLSILLAIGLTVSISTSQYRIIEQINAWESDNVLAAPNKKPNDISSENLRNIIKSTNLGEVLTVITKGTPDYLPIKDKISANEYYDFNPYSKYTQYITDENQNFKKQVTRGGILVSWSKSNSENMNIPIVIYRDSIIKTSEGTLDNPTTTDLGTLNYKVKNNDNKLVIGYHTPIYVYLSIITSLLSILASIFYSIYTKKFIPSHDLD